MESTNTSEEQETLYSPKQVSKITGIESTLLLKWVNYFDIESNWTQDNKAGHRRYTKENVEEILQLKHLIQEKKLNWEQAKVFFEGNEPEFIVDEGKTRIEKKLEEQIELTREVVERLKEQEEFIHTLTKRLDVSVPGAPTSNQEHMVKLLEQIVENDSKKSNQIEEQIKLIGMKDEHLIEERKEKEELQSQFKEVMEMYKKTSMDNERYKEIIEETRQHFNKVDQVNPVQKESIGNKISRFFNIK
ncbi:hypothetical protein AKG34_21300 [Peribacillus butanolivorans]|uniref:MerR family transcriptional regulator n=1 Tax=Peribacillus butanolivorans TaxID=421767 RepID=UPI0006A6C5CA|nr:MerR family transcriptional regulator [Peribacillus butanolivorans]KON67359.1 hypothetical protein AKG34_21300 [Peribacillus butanolivorans]